MIEAVRKRLISVTGDPGSGKSTLVRALEKAYRREDSTRPVIIISRRDADIAIGLPPGERYRRVLTPEERLELSAANHNQASTALGDKKHPNAIVILDIINPTPDGEVVRDEAGKEIGVTTGRNDFARLAALNGANYNGVHVIAPFEEVALERWRRRTGDKPSLEVMRTVHEGYQSPTPAENFLDYDNTREGDNTRDWIARRRPALGLLPEPDIQ